MPTVYTIKGPGVGKRLGDADGEGCRRVRHGKKSGCTIALCPGRSKKGKRVMKFKKGSVRCG